MYRTEYENSLTRYKFDVDDYPYIALKMGSSWKVFHNDNTRKRLPSCNKSYTSLENAIRATIALR